MRQRMLVMVGVFLMAGASFALAQERSGEVRDDSGQPPVIIGFKTMVGNSGPFIGTRNPIRGIAAGGAPWTISEARGRLLANGALHVSVRGLVLVAGGNPVPQFKAIVSCLTIAADGGVATTNLSTGLFPATATGDSEIDDFVDLPQPCFAPLVFVTSPGGGWFAVTGF